MPSDKDHMAARVTTALKTVTKAVPKPIEFERESNARFRDLEGYMLEKATADPFVLHGHRRIAERLGLYLEEFADEISNLKVLRMLDVGPAIGAISTFIYLPILKQHGLLEKLQLYFIDVVPEVLSKTKAFAFPYPEFIDQDHRLEEDAKRLFAAAKTYDRSISEIESLEAPVDIVIAGFVFHHMHPDVKRPAAEAIMRLTRPGSFLGVTDEYFADYERDFAKKHEHDPIPIPIEAPIRLETLLTYFEPYFELLQAHYNRKDHYFFVSLRDDLTRPDTKVYISTPRTFHGPSRTGAKQ
jgi:SAM-dependent methyltransferase